MDHPRLPIDAATCLVYPDGRIGAAAITHAASFASQRIRLPEHLPSDDWIHLGPKKEIQTPSLDEKAR